MKFHFEEVHSKTWLIHLTRDDNILFNPISSYFILDDVYNNYVKSGFNSFMRTQLEFRKFYFDVNLDLFFLISQFAANWLAECEIPSQYM